MSDTSIGCGKRIQYISDDFSRGKLLDFSLNICEIHQLQALNIITLVQLLLGLMETTDHQHINFVVLVNVVLSLSDPLNKQLLKLLITLFRSQ